MRLTPQLIDRYFLSRGEDCWQIISELRELVYFSAINIVDQNDTRTYWKIRCYLLPEFIDLLRRRVAQGRR